MKLGDLVAGDLGEGVTLKARHINVTGTLEAYGHQMSKFVEAHQPGQVRSTIETAVTISGHMFDYHELVGAEIEVHR
jgi:hypothetical protein